MALVQYIERKLDDPGDGRHDTHDMRERVFRISRLYNQLLASDNIYGKQHLALRSDIAHLIMELEIRRGRFETVGDACMILSALLDKESCNRMFTKVQTEWLLDVMEQEQRIRRKFGASASGKWMQTEMRHSTKNQNAYFMQHNDRLENLKHMLSYTRCVPHRYAHRHACTTSCITKRFTPSLYMCIESGNLHECVFGTCGFIETSGRTISRLRPKLQCQLTGRVVKQSEGIPYGYNNHQSRGRTTITSSARQSAEIDTRRASKKRRLTAKSGPAFRYNTSHTRDEVARMPMIVKRDTWRTRKRSNVSNNAFAIDSYQEHTRMLLHKVLRGECKMTDGDINSCGDQVKLIAKTVVTTWSSFYACPTAAELLRGYAFEYHFVCMLAFMRTGLPVYGIPKIPVLQRLPSFSKMFSVKSGKSQTEKISVRKCTKNAKKCKQMLLRVKQSLKAT